MAKPSSRTTRSTPPGTGRHGARSRENAAGAWARRVRSLTGLVLAVGLAASAAAAQARAGAPVNAVATIGMIGDVVQSVGGECVDTTTLMGPGIDPHLYQARSGDVRVLQAAEVIFYAGLSLEGQLGEVLERFGERTATVAVSEAAVPPDLLIATDDAYGVDPHVWMDVGLWARTVPVIADALVAAAPECEATVRANADAYTATLQALDAWVREAIATVPERQRILVTAHDAFGYFGRAYDIEVAGIQGISTESEAGIADIREMASVLAEREVAAVFIESTINPRTVQAVVEAAGERGHAVEIGGELLGDALGEGGTPGGSYPGMIVSNVRVIVGGLGGSLPPLPAELGDWAQPGEQER